MIMASNRRGASGGDASDDERAGDGLALDAGMRFCETVEEASHCCRSTAPSGTVVCCAWDPNHVGVIGVWYSSNTFR